ncbi:MAG TPA: hypothetical protein VLT47_05395 [Anaeromyxobacteraceae bacterium]|nr:hypothetical protein [Anaeromyxobacteraceae bacterium]
MENALLIPVRRSKAALVAAAVAVAMGAGGCASSPGPRLDVAAPSLPPRVSVLEVDTDPDGARVVLLAGPHDVVADCERAPCRFTVPPGSYVLSLDEGSVLWLSEYEHQVGVELAPCAAEQLTVQLRWTGLARVRGYGASGLALGLGVPVLIVGGAWTAVGAGLVGLSALGFWGSHDAGQHRGAVLARASRPLGADGGPGCASGPLAGPASP